MDLLTRLLIVMPAQLVVFALVPFAWWLQSGRPDGSFLRWLGFRHVKDARDHLVLAATICAGLGFFGGGLLGGAFFWPVMQGGPVAFLTVLVIALVQNALPEEVLFRGFLLRWLGERRSGPAVANLVQAFLCGTLRLGAQWLFVDREPASCMAAFALGAGSALMVGWVRQRTGSLWLPWASHGAGNLAAGLIVMAAR